jgi:hypothetical protein
VMALGVLGFFVTLWLAKGIGAVHGIWAKTMLVGRFESAGVVEAVHVTAPHLGGAL